MFKISAIFKSRLFTKKWRQPITNTGLALSVVVLLTASLLPALTAWGATTPPTYTVAENTPVSPVPSTFSGFSIDPANLCAVVSLAQSNPSFLQLFRNLGPGTLRVGGNTGDTKATWSTTGTASCVWSKLVVTPALVDSFFSFAQSIGYRVMWQVPLNNNNFAADAAEAAYVSAKPNVYSVEIGNEPNYYPSSSSKYQTYINNWLTVYNDYLADGGTAPVTGPAVTTSDTFYINPFLSQNASKIIADTGHYYVASSKRSPTPTCSDLSSVTKAQAAATAGVSQASAHGLPFIMNETNSFSSGGVNGASNVFCASLWAASYDLAALNAGAQGLYFHGVANYPNGNSSGTANYYTPINADGSAAPEYYSMLFFNQMTKDGGSNVKVNLSGTATNIETYGVKSPTGLHVALFNRNSTAQTVNLNTTNQYGQASYIALSAPSLTSATGTTLGGSTTAADGTWAPNPAAVTPVALSGGKNATITIPANTALIVSYGATTPPDTTPPTVPGNGTISTTVVGANEIDLSWAASTDDTAVTGYTVTRTGGSGSQVVTTLPGTTTSLNDKNLSASTTYNYSVTASDAAGNTSAPATGSATTDPAPPLAAPTGLHTTGVTTSEVDVAWTASSGATSYSVQRSAGSGSTTVGTTTGTSFADKTVSPNTAYTYTVTALDGQGNSAVSDPLQVTTPQQPTTRQFITNQSLETDLTGWAGVYSTASQNTRVSGGYDGGYSLRSVNKSSSTTSTGFIDKPHWIDGTSGKATIAGKTYTASVWVKADYSGEKISLFLRELNSAGTVMNGSAYKNAITVTAANTNWFNITDVYPATASGDSISFYVYTLSATAGKGFNADLLSLTAPN